MLWWQPFASSYRIRKRQHRKCERTFDVLLWTHCKKLPKEISHNCLSFTLLLWCSMNGQDFISRKSCKLYKNTIKSPKCMPSFLFSKAFQWAGLESLTGWFWASNLMFDTPGLEYDPHRHTDLHVRTGALFNSCSSLLFGRDSQSEGFFWGCKHEGRFYSEDS